LGSWMEHLEAMDWDLMTAPTPARERSFRWLAPHTFHPIDLLTRAWEDGEFPWRPQEDGERVEPLTSKEAVLGYCAGILISWQGFVVEHEGRLDDADPIVQTTRGEGPFSTVVSSQRTHAAYHHRQLVLFLGEHGLRLDGALDVERLPGISLAEELWD
jgi:hypothetical protein